MDAPASVLQLLTERDAARKLKNFHRSDELRKEIQMLGYEVKDTAQGQKIQRI